MVESLFSLGMGTGVQDSSFGFGFGFRKVMICTVEMPRDELLSVALTGIVCFSWIFTRHDRIEACFPRRSCVYLVRSFPVCPRRLLLIPVPSPFLPFNPSQRLNAQAPTPLHDSEH